MDLKGSLLSAQLKIYPSEKLVNFLKSLSVDDDTPENIAKFSESKVDRPFKKQLNKDKKTVLQQLNNRDIENINKIKKLIIKTETDSSIEKESETDSNTTSDFDKTCDSGTVDVEDVKESEGESKDNDTVKHEGPFLTTSDIDWLFCYLQNKRSHGDKDIPYLHMLLEGAHVETPENKIIKRNPILEARCVKLRAQQEAREYRKMTKTVDNVRMRFPEDSISYQLKQLNRQLIAIGQFIISIFAGFLFGFKGVEWLVGSLDFGFKLLLGVMCALVIALAEIYFLAKKLNEELNIPETVQIGGPPKFADETNYGNGNRVTEAAEKEHQE